MLINLTPLRKYRDFRLLFTGQIVSYLGSMVSYMAVPYQVWLLTQSTAMVGALGLVQFGAVLVFSLLGGTYADRLNRRRLLLVSEAVMALVTIALLVNSLLPHPSVMAIFVLVGVLQSVTGFHRPAMEAMTQKMIEPQDYAAVGALRSMRMSLGAIAGPLLGGVLVATVGVAGAYAFDVLSFIAALLCVALMTRTPDPEPSDRSPLADAAVGLRFAVSKPQLIGTYLIDIAAMIFAFPVALFPAMGMQWGGAQATGLLYTGIAIGALLASLFSGWAGRVQRHGRVVVIAALVWGLFIVALGFASSLWLAMLCLILAGAADMFSALFRGVIWNHSVPNAMRGRLSGIEMISYLTGPLLGNARAGWVAAKTSIPVSLWSGGLICMLAVLITALLLPKFWRYRPE